MINGGGRVFVLHAQLHENVFICSTGRQRTYVPRSHYVLTTSLKIKDVVRTWYGLVGRGRNVVRT